MYAKFVENQYTLERVTQEVERMRRGYDDFDNWIKEKIERMRYESLEDKGCLCEGFLLMLRHIFHQYKTQGDNDEAGPSGATSGFRPCVGFSIYICHFSRCMGLPLLHF